MGILNNSNTKALQPAGRENNIDIVSLPLNTSETLAFSWNTYKQYINVGKSNMSKMKNANPTRIRARTLMTDQYRIFHLTPVWLINI